MSLKEKIPALARIAIAGLGVFVAVAGGSPPAMAQASSITIVETVPFADLFTGPCVGEAVALEGRTHIVTHLTFDANGGFHSSIHINTHAAGVGLDSGKRYHSSSVSSDVSNLQGAQVFSTSLTLKVVGPGQGNNFTVTLLVHTTINANGTVTSEVNKFSESCN
jgi:hypothetical protein